MKEIVASITRRGQVTVPAEVRRLLGTDTPGKVVFRIEGREVRLARPAYTLETAFGSVTPINRPEDFKQMSREAREEHAERNARKLRGQ